MSVTDWGNKFLLHYDKYLGNFINTKAFASDCVNYPIQVLEFDNTIPGCRIYLSLGLCRHHKTIEHPLEILVPVEGNDDRIPEILSEAIFYLINKKISLGRGVVFNGIENINKSFVNDCQKTAFYFTMPFNVPDGFDTVNLETTTGYIMTGLFISESEYQFIIKNGPELFENLLQEKNVDPYILSRPSIV